MQYKSFKDGVKLSRLGMGVMRLPILDGDDSKIDFEKAQKLIDQCMKSGINYYNTAYIYHGGKSEEFAKSEYSDYGYGTGTWWNACKSQGRSCERTGRVW